MTTQRNKKIAWSCIGATLLLLVVAGVWWQQQPHIESSAAGGFYPSQSPFWERLWSDPDGLEYRIPKIGLQLQYQLEAESVIQVTAGQQTQENIMEIKGLWTTTHISKTPNRLHWLVELELSQLRFSAMRSDDHVAPLEPMLQQPFQVSLDPQGAVQNFHFDPQLPPGVRTILRMLVMQTQFVRPQKPAPQWQTQEHDTAGQYRAQYRKKDQPGFYQKTKLEYLRYALLSDPFHRAHEQRLRSTEAEAQFRLGANAIVQHCIFHETDQRQTTQIAPEVTTTTRGELQLEKSLQIADPVAYQLRAQGLQPVGPWDAPGIKQANALAQKEEDQNRVQGATYKDLLETYQQVTQSDDPAKARITLFERMRALCRLDPRVINHIGHDLITRQTSTRTASMLTSVLASLNNPQAHTTFLKVLNTYHQESDSRLTDTIVSLVQSPIASKEAVALLKRVVEHQPRAEAGTAAYLGVGIQAHIMRETQHEAYQETLKYLTDRYYEPNNPSGQLMALTALSNTGDPSLVQIVEPEISHGDPQLREVAVDALRLVKTEEADQILSKVMQTDPAEVVRQNAVKSCNIRQLDNLVIPLTYVLQHDPSPKVRSTALQVVSARLPEYPHLLGLVQQTALNDASEKLRREASRYVVQFHQQQTTKLSHYQVAQQP